MSDGTLRQRKSAQQPVPADPSEPSSLDPVDYENRLRFETLVSDVATRLLKVDSTALDTEIEDAQRLICEALGIDLCALWQWAAETPEIFILTHLYRGPDGPPVPERMEASEFHPWSLEQVLAGQIIVLDSTEDAPPEAVRDREVWRHFNIKTTVTIPLMAGDGTPFGAISFNDLQSTRHWSDLLVSRLRLIAQIFGNAILRNRSEQMLRQSEARLDLAAESAGAGLWSLNLDTMDFWATQRARQLFQYGPDNPVTFENFMALVHPDDRNTVHEAVRQCLEEGQDLKVEYRIVDAEGTVRWMASRGNHQSQAWGEKTSLLMGVTVDVTERKVDEQRLHHALRELNDLKDKLRKENQYLRAQAHNCSRAIIGESEGITGMLEEATQVAPTDATVLITGETGTGKELLAQAIHDLSARKEGTLVKVNCAALPAALIESELFGREKGAYTGAMNRQAGRFEIADKSTIMLDEIGDLPLDLQSKLLRVLEDGTFERLGNARSITVDVRLIAATNRDLQTMVDEGTFRDDLFHRLNVFPIEVPPLRNRTVDIPLLTWAFVEEFNRTMGRSVESIPKPTLKRLETYAWPGNVRELRNVIERAMIVSKGKSLELELPDSRVRQDDHLGTMQEVERRHISRVLDQVHWRISGKGGAAEVLGMVPTTLHSRMKKLGISRNKDCR